VLSCFLFIVTSSVSDTFLKVVQDSDYNTSMQNLVNVVSWQYLNVVLRKVYIYCDVLRH
jgi:hypothetical protein